MQRGTKQALVIFTIAGLGALAFLGWNWQHSRHVREGTAGVTEAADIVEQAMSDTPSPDQATAEWCAFLDGRHSMEEWDAHYAAPVANPEGYDPTLVELVTAHQEARTSPDRGSEVAQAVSETGDAVTDYCESR